MSEFTKKFILLSLILTLSYSSSSYALTYLTAYGSNNYLNYPEAVAISEDGSYVFTANNNTNSVSIFSWDESSESLTYIDSVLDDGNGGDATELEGPVDIAVSGNYVFICSIDSVSVFEWDASAQSLTEITYMDELGSPTHIQIFGDKVFINEGHDSNSDSEFTVLSWDESTNSLTEEASEEYTRICDTNSEEGCSIAYNDDYIFLAGALQLKAISYDENTKVLSIEDELSPSSGSSITGLVIKDSTLFTTDLNGVLCAFDWDGSSLTELGCISDDSVGGSATELDGASGITLSGDYIFVTSSQDDAVSVFTWSGSSFSEVTTITDDSHSGDATELNKANSLKIDGDYIFTTSQGDEALSVFKWDESATTLSEVAVLKNDVEIDDPTSISFLNSSQFIVTSSNDNAVRLFTWDSANNSLSITEEDKANSSVPSVSFVSGDYVFIGSNGSLTIDAYDWDTSLQSLDFNNSTSIDDTIRSIIQIDSYIFTTIANSIYIYKWDSDIATLTSTTNIGVSCSPTSSNEECNMTAIGDYLFLVSKDENALAVYKWDKDTEELSSISEEVGGISPTDIVSNDGYVFITDKYSTIHGVVVYQWDDANETLTKVASISDDSVDGGTAQALKSPSSLTLLENHLFVTSDSEDSVTIIKWDESTQSLTESAVIQDDSQGGSAKGLDGANGVIVDEEYIFVTSNEDNQVVTLSYDYDGDGVEGDADCDYTDASIYTGATEVCGDGIDQDCDGSDEACAVEDSTDDTVDDGSSDSAEVEAEAQTDDTGDTADANADADTSASSSGGCSFTQGGIHSTKSMSLVLFVLSALMIMRQRRRRSI
jgi:6-phosphogluconolactonase (cycloisomerase 2 family)